VVWQNHNWKWIKPSWIASSFSTSSMISLHVLATKLRTKTCKCLLVIGSELIPNLSWSMWRSSTKDTGSVTFVISSVNSMSQQSWPRTLPTCLSRFCFMGSPKEVRNYTVVFVYYETIKWESIIVCERFIWNCHFKHSHSFLLLIYSLLWNDKVRGKNKTYFWMSVWWKIRRRRPRI
jgi:hypothetical protein